MKKRSSPDKLTAMKRDRRAKHRQVRDSTTHVTRNGKLTHKPRKAKIPIDVDQTRKLATIGCSQFEIAMVLGCGVQTFQRRLKEEPQLAAAYQLGQVQQFVNLRRLQWRHARADNGTQMTIHLSKHRLGEHDKSMVLNMSVEDLDLLINELERRMVDVTPQTGIEDRTDVGEPGEAETSPPAVAGKGTR